MASEGSMLQQTPPLRAFIMPQYAMTLRSCKQTALKKAGLVQAGSTHLMRLRSSKLRFPLGSDDTIRIVFSYLNERDRLRFLVTTKALGHWLTERRQAACDTLKRLVGIKEQSGHTYFYTKDAHARFICYKTHYVSLFPDDKGLLSVSTTWYNVMRSGTGFDGGSSDLYFSPWVSAFVYAKEINDFHNVEDDENDSVWNRLYNASSCPLE